MKRIQELLESGWTPEDIDDAIADEIDELEFRQKRKEKRDADR